METSYLHELEEFLHALNPLTSRKKRHDTNSILITLVIIYKMIKTPTSQSNGQRKTRVSMRLNQQRDFKSKFP